MNFSIYRNEFSRTETTWRQSQDCPTERGMTTWLTGPWRCSWWGSPNSWRAWCLQPMIQTGGWHSWRACRTAWAAAGGPRRAASLSIWGWGPGEAPWRNPAERSPADTETIQGFQLDLHSLRLKNKYWNKSFHSHVLFDVILNTSHPSHICWLS